MKYRNQGPLVTILIIVIILLLIAIITVSVMIINKPKNKNIKIESKRIIEVKSDYTKYQYILDNLYNNCFDPSKYLNIDSMTDSDKIDLAINNLMTGKKQENINLNITDEIDTTGCTKEDNELTSSDGMILYLDTLDEYKDIFSKTSVENQVKKMFGKNIIINHQTTSTHFYDKTAEAYIGLGGECNQYDYSWFQAITDVKEEKDKVYIYVSMVSLINLTDKTKICYDYKSDEKDCILLSKLDKKYYTKNNKDSNNYTNIDYEKYMKDNIDKFTKYKYTFEKEDNNYIIKKLEKID